MKQYFKISYGNIMLGIAEAETQYEAKQIAMKRYSIKIRELDYRFLKAEPLN
jgi:hypothetical protein